MEKATTEVHTNCYRSKEDSTHLTWEPKVEDPCYQGKLPDGGDSWTPPGTIQDFLKEGVRWQPLSSNSSPAWRNLQCPVFPLLQQSRGPCQLDYKLTQGRPPWHSSSRSRVTRTTEMKLSASQNPGVPEEAAWGHGGKIVWVQIPPLPHVHGGYHNVAWEPNNPNYKFLFWELYLHHYSNSINPEGAV